jgi:hypothetical protein
VVLRKGVDCDDSREMMRIYISASRGVDLSVTSPCSRDQNKFIILVHFSTQPIADHLLHELDVLASNVNRNYVPGHQKRGSASFYALLNQAPAILSLPVH